MIVDEAVVDTLPAKVLAERFECLRRLLPPAALALVQFASLYSSRKIELVDPHGA